jgi:hypothetical protein
MSARLAKSTQSTMATATPMARAVTFRVQAFYYEKLRR